MRMSESELPYVHKKRQEYEIYVRLQHKNALPNAINWGLDSELLETKKGNVVRMETNLFSLPRLIGAIWIILMSRSHTHSNDQMT